MDQLRSLASQLERLREQHYGRVLCVFSAAYLYKQTFAIPGSVFQLVPAYCPLLEASCLRIREGQGGIDIETVVVDEHLLFLRSYRVTRKRSGREGK